VSGGLLHTSALLSTGKVKRWGDGDYGQLGNGARTSSSIPVSVIGIP
jgi:alpha-tubulin suppressor-like RCC1 family protein